jgi:hypothetical protein
MRHRQQSRCFMRPHKIKRHFTEDWAKGAEQRFFMKNCGIVKAKTKRHDFSGRVNAENTSQPFIAVPIMAST